MATWQFDLYLVPKERFSERQSPFPISDSKWEKGGWLLNRKINPDVLSDLTVSMVPINSWVDGTLMWGKEDETHVEISSENGFVDDAWIRIDLRAIQSRNFAVQLVKVAQKLDCLFLNCETRKVFNSDLQSFGQEIQRSTAFKFCKEPEAFFADVIRKNDTA